MRDTQITKESRILDYLNSDRVQTQLERESYFGGENGLLIERNRRFKMYLIRESLELHEYRVTEIVEPLVNFPILKSLFKRVYTVEDLSYSSVFRAIFNSDGSIKIDRFASYLTPEDVIEALDELLFTKYLKECSSKDCIFQFFSIFHNFFLYTYLKV